MINHSQQSTPSSEVFLESSHQATLQNLQQSMMLSTLNVSCMLQFQPVLLLVQVPQWVVLIQKRLCFLN